MLYEYKEEFGGKVTYQSNLVGDLFDDKGNDINFEDLPEELQQASDELLFKKYDNVCLTKFNGKYGVFIMEEYDEYYARELNMPYDELAKIAKNKASVWSEMYPQHDVVVCESERYSVWSDGQIDAGMTINIFLPWNTNLETLNNICDVLKTMRY